MTDYIINGRESPTNINDVNFFQNPVYKRCEMPINSTSAKQQDVKVEVENQSPVDDFARIYSKFLPFNFMKTVNFLFHLLLVIAIALFGSSIRWNNNLYWVVGLQSIVSISWFLFSMALLLLLIYGCTKLFDGNNSKVLALLSIADLCFSSLSIPIMMVISLVFFLQCSIGYTCLANLSLDLLNESQFILHQLSFTTKISPINPIVNSSFSSHNSTYHPPSYHPPWMINATKTTILGPAIGTTTSLSFYYQNYIREIEEEKIKIRTKLILEHIILVLSILLFLINLVNIHFLIRAVKRANLWSNNFRRDVQPKCSDMDEYYAHFWPVGLLILLQWLLPLATLCFIFFYTPESCFSGMFSSYFLTATLLIIFVVHWLIFIGKTRFRSAEQMNGENEETQKQHRLTGLYTIDLVLPLTGILAYWIFITYTNTDYYYCSRNYRYNQKPKYLAFAAIVLSVVKHLHLIWMFFYKFHCFGKNNTNSSGMNAPSKNNALHFDNAVTINGNKMEKADGSGKKEDLMTVRKGKELEKEAMEKEEKRIVL